MKSFEKSLSGNTPKHIKLTISRVRRVIDGIDAKTIADLSAGAVQDFLTKTATTEDMGNRTYNHYVQAIDEFCRWLVETKRATTNPYSA